MACTNHQTPSPMNLTKEIRRYAANCRGLTRTAFALSGCLLTIGLTGCSTAPPDGRTAAPVKPRTYSSFDVEDSRASNKEMLQPGTMNFPNADLAQVLQIYQELSGRTVIRPATLPAPTISIRNQTFLTKVQALQLLDTVLAQNGITMVLAGANAVKAVPEAQAAAESPPEITLPWKNLPESGSYMMRRVHLKGLRPSEVVPVLQPLAKMPRGIMPVDSAGELVLRDYASNIRRMLQLLEDLEAKSTSRARGAGGRP